MFTEEDIDLLLDALDKWEVSGELAHFTANLLGVALARSDEQAKAILESEQAKHEQLKDQRRTNQERVILLKAKLIHLRDKIRVGSIRIEDFLGTDEG